MSTIKSRWDDADYEVGARTMSKFYGSDFQREPPLVSDTMPAARIFNWRMPAPKQSCVSQVIHTGLRLWHFIRLTIIDCKYAMLCRFQGHDFNECSSCTRGGY